MQDQWISQRECVASSLKQKPPDNSTTLNATHRPQGHATKLTTNDSLNTESTRIRSRPSSPNRHHRDFNKEQTWRCPANSATGWIALAGRVQTVRLTTCFSFRCYAVNPRIHIEFSSSSPMAAILRRGPTRWVRLLAWNTQTDVITPGAWFHGRIYEDGCSVSPDGQYFAYFATKYHGRKTRGVDYAWTAVSKLPWLTALVLWPQSETWGGRVRFVDNSAVIIDCPHWETLKTRDHLPGSFTVYHRWIGRDAPEQALPVIPRSSASFNGSDGVDSFGRTFLYSDGQLKRDGHVVVDLKDMVPTPERAPDSAYSW